jgi:hypothetical protein
LPQITVSGYFTLGQSIDGPTAGTNNYSIRDILSTTKGKHTLKVGGEMSLNKDIQQTLLNNYGTFSFTGANYTGVSVSNPLASFVLGLPATMNQDAPVTAIDNSWSYAAFVQDDFRVTHRLTLNLGLRWDIQTPPTDPFNRESTFVPGTQSKMVPNAPLGLLFPGDPGVTRGIVSTDWTHVSPRVGLAWDPIGDGKTSIRASGGIFYGSVSGNEWNTTSNFQPFAARQQFNAIQSLTNPYALLPGGVSPYPYSYDPQNPRFILPANLFAIAENFKWPFTYQFDFSVQRQITRDFTLTGAYVASLAHRLRFAEDVNYPVYSSTATTANVNNRRPIDTGALGSVLLLESNMNASYHGLQLSGEKRFAQHFAVKGSSTFSKTLDDAQLQNNTTQALAEDFHNLSLEKGQADFDARHSLVASFLWQLNYLGRANPWVRGVFNRWQLSGIVTLQSGLPFTATTGADTNLDGNNNDCGNLIGNPEGPQTVAEWFNTAAFAIPAKGADGTSGRNILDGPGLRDVDLGLFRNFKVRERMTLQARAELSNAFNLVSLTIPTQALTTTANISQATMSSPLFGQIRTAAPMRQVQLGLRLTF